MVTPVARGTWTLLESVVFISLDIFTGDSNMTSHGLLVMGENRVTLLLLLVFLIIITTEVVFHY